MRPQWRKGRLNEPERNADYEIKDLGELEEEAEWLVVYQWGICGTCHRASLVSSTSGQAERCKFSSGKKKYLRNQQDRKTFAMM